MLISEMQYLESPLTLQKYSLEYCNPNLHIRYQMSLQQLQQKFKNFNPDTNCFVKRLLMCTEIDNVVCQDDFCRTTYRKNKKKCC